jgi:conjugal transfer pilus assembly protein TrbC
MSTSISSNVPMTRVLTAINVLLWSTLAALTADAHAQGQDPGMLASIRAGWSTFIFVSTEMPHETLVDLAQEASFAHAKLVLRGFPKTATPGAPLNLQSLGSFVTQVNTDCCKDKGAAWLVDPRLFDRYGVRGVPAFVVAWGEESDPKDFSRVDGDMTLANALKFFAQQSTLPAIRAQAAVVYNRGFGGRP